MSGKRVRSEYYEDELIDLTTDDPITFWRDIIRTLITMVKARTAGSSAGGTGGSSSGVYFVKAIGFVESSTLTLFLKFEIKKI